jgi:hypothetical protein
MYVANLVGTIHTAFPLVSKKSAPTAVIGETKALNLLVRPREMPREVLEQILKKYSKKSGRKVVLQEGVC